MSNSQQRIAEICDEVKEMLLDKNMKYGDSALNPARIFSKSDSVEQIKVRIDDKLSRLSQGIEADEEDVINDLIGYLVLLKIAKQRKSYDDGWASFFADIDDTITAVDHNYPIDNQGISLYNTDTIKLS